MVLKGCDKYLQTSQIGINMSEDKKSEEKVTKKAKKKASKKKSEPKAEKKLIGRHPHTGEPVYQS